MSSRPRRTKRSTKRLAIHWLLAAMLVLLNLASLPVVQPFTNLGPQDALAAPCPDPGTADCETDLAVEKTAAATYTPGGSIEFTITITNTGLADGEFDIVGATLTDSVPTEITDVEWTCEASAGSACGAASGAGNDINATYDILEGGTVTYTVTGTAPSADPLPTLSNTATVAVPADVIDLDDTNNSSTVEVAPAAALSDLSITKLDDPDPVQVNGELTYTIQVSNAGPDDAADATVVDTLPADVTFGSADGGADWTCAYEAGTHAVNCDANAAIAAGVDPAAITITVTAPAAAATLDNSVTVSSTTDANTGDNTATASTTVEAPDLPFVTCSTDSALFNTGYNGAGGQLPVGALDSNWDAALGDPLDPNTIPSAWIDATVVGQVVPAWEPSPFGNAEWISYYTDATHTGEVDVYYRFEFELDSAVVPDSFALAIDYYVDNSVWEVYVNGVPQSGNLADVPQDPADPYFHGGFVAGSQAQTVLTNDWQTGANELIVHTKSAAPRAGFLAQVTSESLCAADVSIVKSAAPDPAVPDEDLAYTLQVSNAGPGSAADATVTDTLPAEVGFVSVDGGADWACTYDAGTHAVTCLANAILPIGDADPITVTVTAPATPTSLVNAADVTSTPADPNPDNNTSTITTPMDELDWTPWVCDGRALLNLVESIDDPSIFYWVDTRTDPYGFEEAYSNDEYTLNAIGYDNDTDLVWATAHSRPAPSTFVGIISIDGAGVATDPIIPTGLPDNSAYVAGTVANGVYYITNGDLDVIYAIDLTTFDVEAIQMDRSLASGDITFAPDGWIYAGVNVDTGLVRVDPTAATPTVENVTVGGMSPGAFGSIWANASGDLFLYENTGDTIVQIDLNLGSGDDPVVRNTVAAEDQTGGSDATNCTDYVPFADLAITKTADPDPVAPVDTLTYTLQVSNLGADSAADATVTDTLPADVTFISVDGGADWTCAYDDVTHAVECTANGEVPLGPADPITVEVRAPLAQVSLVNEASITSTTDDPDPNNNTSTITTEMEELDWTPFVCDGSGYIMQDPPGGDNQEAQLYRVNTSVLPYTFEEIGGTHPDYIINAIGYHPIQNVIYGWAWDNTAGGVITGLVRVDATGEVAELGIPTGMAEVGYHIGAISNDGTTYYVSNGTDFYAVDLASMTAEEITISPAYPGGADIAESPTEPGVLYSTVGGNINRIELDLAANTGTVASFPIQGYPADASGVGGAWMTADGDFIAYANNGIVIQVDLDDPQNPEAIAVVRDAPSSGSNDGASCTAREVMADLSVTKVADPDPAVPLDTLTYTVQVNNAGPDSAADATVVDSLPAEVTFLSVDGGADWTCTYDDGAHAVNCVANGPVPLGNTDPILVTVRAPAAPTTLVNNAEVTSSTEDPDPDDNTTTTTTEMEDLDWTPFVCDGSGYIIQDPTDTAAIDAQLYRVNTGQLPYTFEEIGDATPYMINALGYHPTQNVLYGFAWERATGVPDVAIGVVRIDATGEVTELGVPTGLPDPAYHVGAVSNDGATYYLRVGGTEMYAVDLATMTATTITLDQDVTIADFAERPGEPGVLYHVTNDTGELVRITIDEAAGTGTVDLFTVPGLTGAAYGGSWFTAQGDLIVYDNAGTVYQISLDDPANPEVIATVENAPASSSNDGAACAAREPSADLSMDKIADPEDVVSAGEQITYTLQVFNAGPDRAEGVVVTDTLPAGIASVDSVTGDGWSCTTTIDTVECTRDSLGIGNAPPITVTVTTGATGGDLVNTATVTSNTEDPDEENNEDDTTTTNAVPEIVVDKVAEQITDIEVGDTIEYFYYVTNIGNVELTNVALEDDLIGPIACSLSTLPANGGTMTCVGEYVVTQADFDAGEIVNVATVTGDPPGDLPPVEDTDEERVPNSQQPGIDVDKFAEAVDDLVVGDVITYYYVVTNTGNVTLTNITAEDDLIDSVACPITTLAPSESTTCTAEYTVTQADFDNGEVTNVATVTGEDPDGEVVEEEDEETVPNDNQQPRVLVDKVAENVTELVPNDVIEYEYIVTNVGNVTLTNISVDDDLIVTVNCPDVDLAPGDSATCTGSYTVTQADVDRGEIVNIAVVTAEDPDGDEVEDEDREEVPDEEQVASIDVDKAAEQSGSLQAGDELQFNFIVTNTGSVTLTEIEVDDPLIQDVSCPFTQLPPGESMTCTGDYTVTEADVSNGEVVNQATVTGETPDGGEVDDEDEERVPTDEDEDPTDPTPTEPTEPGPTPTEPTEPDPTPTEPTDPDPTPTEPTEPPTSEVDVDKIAEYVPELVAGDVIDYQFVVTNSGSVTLEDISVDDPLISNVSCPATELGPGESMTCTGSYTVTDADVANGQVVNNVTVSGDPEGDDPPVEDEDEEIVPNDPQPDMEVDKVAEPVTELVAGDVIDYQFIVTNTGNLDLTDVSVDDPLIPNVSCPATELAMGESMTCTGSYTVTEADVENGQVVNDVTVSGDPEGDEPPIEDEDQEIVPNEPGPGEEPDTGIQIDKVAEYTESLVVGDVIDYHFIITNTGDETISSISVDDPLIPSVSCPATELAGGQSMTCTGSYTVTEADVENGQVVNDATVSGETPDGDSIEHDDQEIVPNEPEADLTLDKEAEQVDELVEGDVIEYQFIVTNTGNVSLTGVEVTDLLIPDVSCPTTQLDPGETMTCTAEYTVTASDVAEGSVVNVASVTADAPEGLDPPQDTDTEVVPQVDDGDDGDGDGKDDDDDDGKDYPQLPPDTGLDGESAAGSQGSSAQILFMLTVFGMWMLAAGLALNSWQRRRSMP